MEKASPELVARRAYSYAVTLPPKKPKKKV